MDTKWVVVGIGNPLLQDDRAGVIVVEQLEQEGLPCRTEVIHSVGFEVLDRIRGYERAIIVDACVLGSEPGRIVEARVDDIFFPHASGSGHGLTLGTTLKVGLLCCPDMPADIRLFLIEVGEIKEFNLQVSAEVEVAVVLVKERIRALVELVPDRCRSGIPGARRWK